MADERKSSPLPAFSDIGFVPLSPPTYVRFRPCEQRMMVARSQEDRRIGRSSSCGCARRDDALRNTRRVWKSLHETRSTACDECQGFPGSHATALSSKVLCSAVPHGLHKTILTLEAPGQSRVPDDFKLPHGHTRPARNSLRRRSTRAWPHIPAQSATQSFTIKLTVYIFDAGPSRLTS